MRIVSYNILDGGTGRADPLAEVLLAQRPDVVVLVEAIDPEVTDRIARRLGMDHVAGFGPERKGKVDAVAILTGGKIHSSVNHALLVEGGPRALLEADVEVADFRWTVFGVHLSAGARVADEQVRLGEAEVLLKAAARRSRDGDQGDVQTQVLAGDFNSLSPRQFIDLKNAGEKVRAAADENRGMLPRDVVERIERGFGMDTFRAAGGDDAAGTFTTRHPDRRVDYIFLRDVWDLEVTSAWIETDRLAKYASDHFPIGAEIE